MMRRGLTSMNRIGGKNNSRGGASGGEGDVRCGCVGVKVCECGCEGV